MNVRMIVFTTILFILFVLIIRSYIVSKNILTSLSNATVSQTIAASSLGSTTSGGSSNFAFSIWFYISNWNYRYGERKIIFGRMNSTSAAASSSSTTTTTSTTDPTCVTTCPATTSPSATTTASSTASAATVPPQSTSGTGPSPLVSLGAISNDLEIALAYFPDSTSTVTSDHIISCPIQNIPIQQWVNLTLSVYGRTLDTYINGKLVKTCLMKGVANVNQQANVYVTPGGGFEGSTTKLAYYPYALNPEQSWNIYQQGYGNGILSNLFGKYKLNISLSQNGNQTASVTI